MSKDSSDSRMFDVRLLERNIRRGLLTRKEVDKHLKTLPDVKDKGEQFADNPYEDDLDDGDDAEE